MFAPKHIHSGKAVVEIANFLAVCIFNGSYVNILKIMEVIGIIIDKSVRDLALSRKPSQALGVSCVHKMQELLIERREQHKMIFMK